MSDFERAAPEVDPVEEELIAYLDGELAPDHRARVEHRLAQDERYREQLRHLQKSWDMLDLLDRAEPDEGFTQTTVELVALRAKDDVEEQKQTDARQGWIMKLGVAGAVIASLVAGFAIVRTIVTAPDRQLVRDLQVIEHLDEYKNAQSVDFLQSLQSNGLFAVEGDDGP